MLCVSEYLDCKGPDYLDRVMLMKSKIMSAGNSD